MKKLFTLSSEEFAELPKNARSRIEQALEKVPVVKPALPMQSSFDWEKTPQGHAFWALVRDLTNNADIVEKTTTFGDLVRGTTFKIPRCPEIYQVVAVGRIDELQALNTNTHIVTNVGANTVVHLV